MTLRYTESGLLTLHGSCYRLTREGGVEVVSGDGRDLETIRDEYRPLALDLAEHAHSDPVAQAGEAVVQRFGGALELAPVAGYPHTGEHGNLLVY